jgi:hypothetical protein
MIDTQFYQEGRIQQGVGFLALLCSESGSIPDCVIGCPFCKIFQTLVHVNSFKQNLQLMWDVAA